MKFVQNQEFLFLRVDSCRCQREAKSSDILRPQFKKSIDWQQSSINIASEQIVNRFPQRNLQIN